MNIAVPAVVDTNPPVVVRCTHTVEPIRRYDHTPHMPHAVDTVEAVCPQCEYVFWRARRDLLDE